MASPPTVWFWLLFFCVSAHWFGRLFLPLNLHHPSVTTSRKGAITLSLFRNYRSWPLCSIFDLSNLNLSPVLPNNGQIGLFGSRQTVSGLWKSDWRKLSFSSPQSTPVIGAGFAMAKHGTCKLTCTNCCPFESLGAILCTSIKIWILQSGSFSLFW